MTKLDLVFVIRVLSPPVCHDGDYVWNENRASAMVEIRGFMRLLITWLRECKCKGRDRVERCDSGIPKTLEE